jgi:hypothetical protein
MLNTAHWQRPVQAILPIGADRAGEDHGPGCPQGHHEVTVPQALPLTVILLGSRLDRREDGRPFCNTHGSAGSLRRSARTVGRGDNERADAAVARQGLRAARGARARNGFPG